MGAKKWLNGVFLETLKDGVASGEFVKVKAEDVNGPLPEVLQEAAEAYLLGIDVDYGFMNNLQSGKVPAEMEFFISGDGWSPDEVMCNSNLQLVDCTSPAANWYFTGAQYISSLCWSKGYDAVMQVSDDCSHMEVTTSPASEAGDVPITLSQTFMLVEADSGFIDSIVPGPTPSSAP